MRSSDRGRGSGTFLLLILAATAGLPAVAFGLATEDRGNAPLLEANYQEWKGTGIMSIVNHQSRVYHTWVNGNEHFYYRGDSRALNDMLEAFARLDVEPREVVLLPGPGSAETFDGEVVPYDWRLHLLTGIAGHGKPPGSEIEPGEKNPTLAVFAGGSVELDEVRIPEGATVLFPADVRERYLKALGSPGSGTRSMAAYRLAELEPYNRENVALFVDLLDDEGDAPYLAVGALGKMGRAATEALPAIERALENQNELGRRRFRDVITEIREGQGPAEAEKIYRESLDEINTFRRALQVREIGVHLLWEAARQTYARAVESGVRADPDGIPAEFWGAAIRRLKPLRVYSHGVSIVVVLQSSNGEEEGVYIHAPVSSHTPRSGDGGFVLTEIAENVYRFRRAR